MINMIPSLYEKEYSNLLNGCYTRSVAVYLIDPFHVKNSNFNHLSFNLENPLPDNIMSETRYIDCVFFGLSTINTFLISKYINTLLPKLAPQAWIQVCLYKADSSYVDDLEWLFRSYNINIDYKTLSKSKKTGRFLILKGTKKCGKSKTRLKFVN